MNISITDIPAQSAIVTTRKAAADSPDMESIVFSALPAVSSHLATAGVSPAGAPFRRITAMNDDTLEMEFEVGFPVSSPAPVAGDMLQTELPVGQAATIIHEGSYDSLPESYAALCTWVEENNKQMAGGTWEVYLTSQLDAADAKDWRTQIYLPIA